MMADVWFDIKALPNPRPATRASATLPCSQAWTMIGIHQVFEVRRQSDAEPEDKRNQNNQREKATISWLGIPLGLLGEGGSKVFHSKIGIG